MNFHVLTLFPDMIIDGLNTSITGRAIKNGCLSVEAVNIRDYANNKHMKVDDYPYGGGAGLVMQAAPVCAAYDSLVQKIGKKPELSMMTPQGYTFNQKMAQDFAKEDDLVILCGHYEGIDERALETKKQSVKYHSAFCNIPHINPVCIFLFFQLTFQVSIFQHLHGVLKEEHPELFSLQTLPVLYTVDIQEAHFQSSLSLSIR